MTKNLRGNCQHCGGSIEFPAEHTGEAAPCPHCGLQTELMLPAPPPEANPLKARAIIFIGVALLILVGGVVAAQIAVKRAKRMAGQSGKQNSAARLIDPIAQAGFQVSAVTLEKAANSTVTYAVGKVTELAGRKRFGVRVELALFDREGKLCGSAKDYSATLDAGSQWQFRAMVITPQAARAEIKAVTEDK